jgi:hypothetical protein
MATTTYIPGIGAIGSAVGGLFGGLGTQHRAAQHACTQYTATGQHPLAWSPPAGDLMASVDPRQMQMWQRALEAKGQEWAAQLGRSDFNLPRESVLALQRAKMIAENDGWMAANTAQSTAFLPALDRVLWSDLAPWFWTGVGLVIGLIQFLGVF